MNTKTFLSAGLMVAAMGAGCSWNNSAPPFDSQIGMDREKVDRDEAEMRASAVTNSVNQVDPQNPQAASGAPGGGTVGVSGSTSSAPRNTSAFGAPGGTGIIPPGGPILQPSSNSPGGLGSPGSSTSGTPGATIGAAQSSSPSSRSATNSPPPGISPATNNVTPNP